MTPSRPLSRPTTVASRTGLVIVGLGLLAIPPAIVGVSGVASVDALWTALRIAALEAATLISAGLTVGAFRPLLGRVIRAKTLHRLHISIGVTGFGLAIAHGIMVAFFGLAGYGSLTLLVMPLAVLAVLLLLVGSAVARRRFRRAWKWVHRLAYPVLAVILLHAFWLGYDMKAGSAMRTVLAIYAAVAATGLVYRLSTSWGIFTHRG